MTSKCLVAINLGGGMDGLNLVSMRDSTSVSLIQNFRQGAPANVLDYTEAVTKVADSTAGSEVLSGINTSGLTTGMKVFANDVLPRQRGLVVESIDAGASTVTLSGKVVGTHTDVTFTFATPTQLYKSNSSTHTSKNYGLHFTQEFLADSFNVADTEPNAGKVKSALISNIGPMRRKLFLDTGGTFYNFQVRNADGSTRLGTDADKAPHLTSHNDQTHIWLTNAPEGSVKGWGGGIADLFLSDIGGALNIPLASVSASGPEAFVAGSFISGFLVSNTGLVRRVPGFGVSSLYDEDEEVDATLTELLRDASVYVSPTETNQYMLSAKLASETASAYQDILLNALDITDPPAAVTAEFEGSVIADPKPFLANLKQLARMIHTNNPIRGHVASRSGTTVTLVTEVSAGTATRVEGDEFVTITMTDHRFFTSTLNPNTDTDSVLITGLGGETPEGGYKITRDPLDPLNKFTVETPEETDALTSVAVTARLKHNLTTANVVFVNEAGFDTTLNSEGYAVTAVTNNYTFTVSTTSSGAYASGNALAVKAKLINLPKQILYTATPGFSWDSHDYANHNQLAALNEGLKYFNSLVELMPDADVVTCSITEFGRTVGVNSKGTDHGWGNYAFVFGKSVKGNTMYGDAINLAEGGPHNVGFLFPSTSVYQYGATFASWLGASDAEILELFPDLVYWPEEERVLGFL